MARQRDDIFRELESIGKMELALAVDDATDKQAASNAAIRFTSPLAAFDSLTRKVGYGVVTLTIATIVTVFCISPAFALSPDDVVEPPAIIEPGVTGDEATILDEAVADLDAPTASDDKPSAEAETPDAAVPCAESAQGVTTIDKLADLPQADKATTTMAQSEASRITYEARAASDITVSTEQELFEAIASIVRNGSATITLSRNITLTKAININLPISFIINLASYTLKTGSTEHLFNVSSSVDVVEASFYGGASSCLDTTSSSGLFKKSSSCNFLFEFQADTFKSGTLGSNLSNSTIRIRSGNMETDKTIYVGDDALFELDSTAHLVSTASDYAIEINSGGYFNMNGGSFSYKGPSKNSSAIRCDSGGAFHIYNNAALDVDGVYALYCESGSSLDFGSCYVISHDGSIATGKFSGVNVLVDKDARPEFSDISIKPWLDANGYALITADGTTYYGISKATAQAESIGSLDGIYYSDKAYYDSIKGGSETVDPNPGPGPSDPVDPNPKPNPSIDPVGPVDPTPNVGPGGTGEQLPATPVTSGANGGYGSTFVNAGRYGSRIPSAEVPLRTTLMTAAPDALEALLVEDAAWDISPTALMGQNADLGEDSVPEASLYDVRADDGFSLDGPTVARVIALAGGTVLAAVLAARVAGGFAASAKASRQRRRKALGLD